MALPQQFKVNTLLHNSAWKTLKTEVFWVSIPTYSREFSYVQTPTPEYIQDCYIQQSNQLS